MQVADTNEKPRVDVVWLAGCAAVTVVAAFLRFYNLALKPFHHDEGVNGFFLTSLFRDGMYKYDPANYHGPTLYYISLFFAKLFGLNTISVRASVAVFGVLTVVLVFFLRPFIGKVGSLAAAAFIALSPGMVFISRYFIHEIFFVFVALALVLSILLFIRNEKAGPYAVGWMVLLLLVCFLPSGLLLSSHLGGDSTTTVWAFRIGFFIVEAVLVFFVTRLLLAWRGGRPIYMLLASAATALMFATKETAFITLGTMLIAMPCVLVWRKTYGAGTEADELRSADDAINWRNFRDAVGTGNDLWLLIAAAAVVFVYVNVLFFSSFFTYPEGVQKALEAYAIWTKTGVKDHTYTFWTYAKWGASVEGPIFVVSAIGMLIAFFVGRHRVAMFTGLWALGLFIAYSIIPYKTPWLALSFILPMCLVAGYGINELVRSTNAAARASGVLFGVAACAILGYQAYDLNFVNYDNNDRTYVYAHTRREFLTMMGRIEYYAQKSGKKKDVTVDVISPDYWPMVWYTNDLPKAVYHGRMIDNSTAEMIVAKKTDQDQTVIARYSGKYKIDGIYGLRPGVDLVLLVRNDIADPDAKDLYRLKNP